ncbi:MAG: sterol desaturase family protein [Myxococcota bacterium]
MTTQPDSVPDTSAHDADDPVWRDRPPRVDPTLATDTPFEYYTLGDAMSLRPADYVTWVYAPRTPKVNEVRVVERSLFLNRLLTKCKWWVPLLVWPPIIAWQILPLTPARLGWVALGLLLWFPVEYLFHRFLFHMPIVGRVTQFVHFLLHGVHHVAPKDDEHLVSPPLDIVIQGAAIWALLTVIGVPDPVGVLLGLLINYIRYDMTHYSVHFRDYASLRRMPLIGGYLSRCKAHHMAHHFRDPSRHFTISYLSRLVD